MKVVKLFNDSLSGLVNYVTGTGTSRDKITHARWIFERPHDQQLSALYRSTWIAKKLVDVPISDILREGWTWQAEDEDLTKLEEEEERHGLKQKLREALVRDSVFGGGALIMGTGGDPGQPLVVEDVPQGGLEYLIVSGRGELTVKELVRTPGPDYGQPRMFEMLSSEGTPIEIHPSRVVTFNATAIIAPLGVKSEDDFWGDSRLASVMRDIAAAMSGVAATGRLMEELAVTYHKISGFTERMSEKDGEEQVRRVIDLMSQMKSSVQSVAIDAEDDIEVITANFAGVPEAVRSLMQNVSGGGDIPLTRFLGSSPDGMNATGASDLRNYYDRLTGQRESEVTPGLTRIDRVLIRSALGKDDKSVYRVWHPMWQLTETEQVDLDAKKTKIMIDLSGSAIIHDHVSEQVMRNMMIDSPTFSGAETAFKEADKMPDPPPEEVAAANQLQAGGGPRPGAPGKPQLRVVGDSGLLEDWDLDDVKAWMSQPRHPAGTRQGGQWTTTGGASGSGSAQLGRAFSRDEVLSKPKTKKKDLYQSGPGGFQPEESRMTQRAYELEKNPDGSFKNPNDRYMPQETDAETGKTYHVKQVFRPVDDLVETGGEPPENNPSVKAYTHETDATFDYVNSHLRHGDALRPKDGGVIQGMDQWVASGSFKRDVVLRRGISHDGVESLLKQSGGVLHEGTVFQDKAYVSTTRDHHVASAYANRDSRGKTPGYVMMIKVPKGHPGNYAGKAAENDHHDEFILPRGQRFRITRIDPERRVMDVELVFSKVEDQETVLMGDTSETVLMGDTSENHRSRKSDPVERFGWGDGDVVILDKLEFGPEIFEDPHDEEPEDG